MAPPPALTLLAEGALLLFIAGFLTRDELKLRALIIIGCAMLITVNSMQPAGPNWTPIVHNSVIGSINVTLLVLIVRERSTIGMGHLMLKTYRNFPTFNPGQFRQFMRIGDIREFDAETPLCTLGEFPDALYLVLEGEVRVSRPGSAFRVGSGNFIGEVSLLLDGPASANATALPGTRCVVWHRPDLARLMSRSPAIANALNALLNKDLARKLSTSAPAAVEAI